MILVADAGATKTTWCLLKDDGTLEKVNTEGYNPYFVDADYISNSVRKGFENVVGKDDINEVHYYGSGCFPGPASIVREGIARVFGNADIFVELDLLAAARSALGTHPGFVAILGTGTNTCVYDGRDIVMNIDSLGYILGDEGSGAAIGKKVLAAFIRGDMPEAERELFVAEYQLDKEKIFREVYSSLLPNRFCAGFATFVHKHIRRDYFTDLIENCFRDFFRNLVTRYDNYETYTFNCIGSIGYQFADQLKKIALEFSMQPGRILKSPIDGLIVYHRHQ